MRTVLQNSQDCTGCGACVSSCSVNAISMSPNSEGFIFPVINEDNCINCGACERTCPINQILHNKNIVDSPHKVFAVWNNDRDIRYKSSSGGIFTALATKVLTDGGIVIGAAFDFDYSVRHVIVSDLNNLSILRGAKYVQSYISKEIYFETRKALQDGKKVLFSGTPCQIAGMKSFIKNNSNIVYVDILCHGVPSPLLWKKYLNHISKNKDCIRSISFRDKMYGWKLYSMNIEMNSGKRIFEKFYHNKYLKSFLLSLSLRMSCYSCVFAHTERVGDISLGDFWGVEKQYPHCNVDLGVSLVLVNSNKGYELFLNSHNLTFLEISLSDAIPGNSGINKRSTMPIHRNKFYETLNQFGFGKCCELYSLSKPSIFQRLISALRRNAKFGKG